MKIILGKSIFVIVLGLIVILSSCSSEDKSKSPSTSSTTSPRTATTLSQSDFTKQVQVVCDSVDPKVFDAILKVDPVKDQNFQAKFDEATQAIGNLEAGFSAIKPSVDKSAQWQRGLDSLSSLKSQVNLVSKQYAEYVALLAESETNTDPARTIAILTRLIALGGEYTENLNAVNESFTSVLTVGSSAGISKCRAFEIGTSP